VFKSELKRVMKEHGINNQQEVYQNPLRNVIAVDFKAAARMLRCVTTPFVIIEVSRACQEESLAKLKRDPGSEN